MDLGCRAAAVRHFDPQQKSAARLRLARILSAVSADADDQKDAALTSRGLEIFYNMQFTTNYEFFPWEDINAIVCEDRGHADMVRLHIGHGNTEKALFFPREDLDEIYAFIKRRIRRSASWIMPRPNRSPARSTRSEQL